MGNEKISSILYHGDTCMGEVCIYPHDEEASLMDMIVKEIHISHFSCPSKRCSPLVVLHSIASTGFCFKMEPNGQQSQNDSLNLINLYNACLQEAKTAIVALGGNELHLVAMPSGNSQKHVPCFWGFNVVGGLYAACLGMLNLRCLAVVFDLDETLLVANTLRSLQDRIEALKWRISGEIDPKLVAGMSTEIRRYQDDQKVLKQFVENDHIYYNGKLIKAQSEIVPAPSEDHPPLVRPIIRLCEQRIILTRIDPTNRDTSILVRMRPSWEELRNYLTADGRKRFEVFVCTMSEKEYALEMWRLLDPEASLISPKDLHNRVVCVKPGFRKFLLKVFHHGICHPKLAMVIDDRLNVWEDTDQSRVHVVPAFAPYSVQMVERCNPDPVLLIVRDVICKIRIGFFSDFDKGLLKRMAHVLYETDVKKLPAVPDVSKYFLTENKENANNNLYLPVPNGMRNSEVEAKLNLRDQNLLPNSDPSCDLTENRDVISLMQPLQQAQEISTLPSSTHPQQCDKAIKNSYGILPVDSSDSQGVYSEPSNSDSPAREEGEISESEMYLNTKWQNLILQHGQDPVQCDIKASEAPLLWSMKQSKLPPNQHPVRLAAKGKLFSQLTKASQGIALDSGRSFDVCSVTNNSFYCSLDNHLQSNICKSKRPPTYKIKTPLHKKHFRGHDKHKHKPGVNHITKKPIHIDPDVS
ncbi:hypothetical protein SUGI_1067360 [Cryptomeria japonica]|uniref:RNA polymerase II C-terminal domain phosphatase-like 1 n=1 Tax=Cryptomeria japonica TaxID=3369 RepID=UPI00241477D9|nr:RNA polymerase II C-terminal domain phosphatase-like 1 [Cryptomeria japonica]GLJ50168.1 hypothetical protein SUGI_1067360 [Cryptomeria japonica]